MALAEPSAASPDAEQLTTAHVARQQFEGQHTKEILYALIAAWRRLKRLAAKAEIASRQDTVH